MQVKAAITRNLSATYGEVRMTSPRVVVLMSTYNGEMFLREQLQSLLDQDYSNIEILIRDDGSTDATCKLLDEYARLKGIRVFHGNNLGAMKSFFELLRIADDKADYFAFCDQDDVWFKNKISRALSTLTTHAPRDCPAMYCSRYTMTDASLRVLGSSPIARRKPRFANALVENVATGCTIVMNHAARDLICKTLPGASIMHDWWIYQVVSGLGAVFYDPLPTLFYRQHGRNTVGAEIAFIAKWTKRLRRFRAQRSQLFLTSQAQELRRIFGDRLSSEDRRVLDNFLLSRPNLVSRLGYISRSEVFRQSWLDDCILKLLLLAGKV